jgi:putative transposase
VRDEVVDFVATWSSKTELPAKTFVGWLTLNPSKYFNWKQRYGLANEHNARVPRDHWLEPEERQAIIKFAQDNPLEGYRRQTFMMLDKDIAYASPTTVYRVLKKAGLLSPWNAKPSKKGTGFAQPEKPHDHWHTDISYVNVCGTFYYLCSVLDGCSRSIVHWELRRSMTEPEVELVLQKAREKYPNETPRIITDNGPQFIARDFKEFIRVSGMTHVRTSPYYPQSNGKIERWHKSLKTEAIRQKTPLSEEDARTVIAEFVEHYNKQRLHSAIGYIAPQDRLDGKQQAIWNERDRKLEAARAERSRKRQQRREQSASV